MLFLDTFEAKEKMSCSIQGCPTLGENKYSGLFYHKFPENLSLAKKWLKASGWPYGYIDIRKAKICSIHFEAKYLENIEPKKEGTISETLKPGAIPTLHLPSPANLYVKVSSKEELKTNILTPKIDSGNTKEVMYSELKDIQSKNKEIEEKIHQITKSNDNMQKLINRKAEKLAKIRRQLKVVNDKLTNRVTYSQKKLLSKIFTNSQIKILCGNKKFGGKMRI
ncbi:hypothetical protein HHI36_011748 [Cryptolaemus montrouzieri]|uniref:THAP-type domain-containing protein n=1 Tax=Cryptolaemus montrouzieri TaxID=559131 RepID=A0ABD2ND81_9CUCU